MKACSTKRDQITAIHEAGHVVAYIVLDVDFEYVTIASNGDSRGHVACIRPNDIVDMWEMGDRENAHVRYWVERTLIISFAGNLAQRRAFPRSPWRHGFGIIKSPGGVIPEGAPMIVPESDLGQMSRILYDLFGDDETRFAYHTYIQARAESLVRHNWQKIECVADALLKNRTLSSDEVRRVLFPEMAKIMEAIKQ